ncbi:MAG: hypothetical protein L6U16_08375 [Porphyromonadaceae bacterium]|nr:MAG: hypothetical protein L6U16_08375 [Porphyromonadaceae bacterium]
MFETLKPLGRQVWETFTNILKSLKMGVSFDINGMPEWGVSIGDIHAPDVLLDEIFKYLEHAGKPSIVAFDEFQVIANYPEKTVEATLRKRIQNCHNTHFIYSGSKTPFDGRNVRFTMPDHFTIVQLSWGWSQSTRLNTLNLLMDTSLKINRKYQTRRSASYTHGQKA